LRHVNFAVARNMKKAFAILVPGLNTLLVIGAEKPLTAYVNTFPGDDQKDMTMSK
jgi:hypothetical protein